LVRGDLEKHLPAAAKSGRSYDSVRFVLTALLNSSAIFSPFLLVVSFQVFEIRRCLPFSSGKQAIQYCDSGADRAAWIVLGLVVNTLGS
jgi:hypothetical protein